MLHHTAEGGNVYVIRELINRGCEINATDEDNITPLHIVACNGKTEAALELIRHGADKAIVAGRFGTPLHLAVCNNHVSTVRALIRCGCSVDAVVNVTYEFSTPEDDRIKSQGC